ncbi:MAG: cyclic nucleotide-binding domain-containing protein [Desulfobacterales bacterium]|nr:cyclic nucleotide-binding domain-containing protein [Desulfobacterales bacterium]
MIESKYLKDNIENIQKLMAIPALRNFETKSLGKLLKLSKIREYEDGEAIIREGDQDTWLYFLLSGKIRITKENLEIGVIDKKGEIFGEMRIIDSMHRSATVVGRRQDRSASPSTPPPRAALPPRPSMRRSWTSSCCSTASSPSTCPSACARPTRSWSPPRRRSST